MLLLLACTLWSSTSSLKRTHHSSAPCLTLFLQEIGINDIVRGQVTWNTDNLGDFVVLRSNGLPVYNFCVAIDDALMGISHVLRAEEHLPNTLRQVREGWYMPASRQWLATRMVALRCISI